MSWVLVAVLMFLSSVALYLCVRQSTALGTPQPLNNLAMFLIPGLMYLAALVGTPTDMTLTVQECMLMLVSAVLFAYLGNVFSLHAMQNAPNPGYSLMISKSYVVLTAVASVWLFQASLTLVAAVAILIIVGFSALILIDPKVPKAPTITIQTSALPSHSLSWVLSTWGAFFCWGFLALSSKYLLNMGVPVLARLTYAMFIVSAFILMEIRWRRISLLPTSRAQLGVLGAIGVFGALFNYFMQLGYTVAPNVGYINAANAGSISLLTVMSAVFFHDQLSVRKMTGVIGVLAGLCLLFLQ